MCNYIARQYKEDRDGSLTEKIPMRVPEWMSAPEGRKADLRVFPEVLNEYC